MTVPWSVTYKSALARMTLGGSSRSDDNHGDAWRHLLALRCEVLLEIFNAADLGLLLIFGVEVRQLRNQLIHAVHNVYSSPVSILEHLCMNSVHAIFDVCLNTVGCERWRTPRGRANA